MTREEVLTKLRALKPWLEESYGVTRLALFGSHARNEARSDSDVDLLVDFAPGRTPGIEFFGMHEEIGRRLGAAVDLATFDGVKPHYEPYILKDLVNV